MISVDDAVREISNGKIIIYPTDTVWGIGCDAFNQDAVDRLFKLKEKKELLLLKLLQLLRIALVKLQ